MTEKILILTRDSRLGLELASVLKDWGVEIVEVLQDQDLVVSGELIERYNTIIVDKRFCGQALHTAAFIRGLRTEFFDPIIGFEAFAGDGELVSLQVAGCNFIIPPDHWEKVCNQICHTVDLISRELAQPCQQV